MWRPYLLKNYALVRLLSSYLSIVDMLIILEYGIDALTLTQLAKILLSTRIKAYYPTAINLFMAASGLKDPAASLFLVLTALAANKLNTAVYNQPRKHFEDLVSAKNPAALFIQGKIHERHGHEDRALALYVECTTVIGGGFSGAETLDINFGDVWRAIGLLKKKRSDLVGAEEALKKAALEFDDHSAYLHLATEFTDSSPGKYEAYLLLASSSGEPEAIGKLGSYYFRKVQEAGHFPPLKPSTQASEDSKSENSQRNQKQRLNVNGTLNELPLLEEWLEVGVGINHPASHVYRGILHRVSQEHDLGLDCLHKASESPKWANTVDWLTMMWYSKDIDINNLDIEDLQRRMDGNKIVA